MKKPKILFITQDLAVGGGTSSLSSLYDVIRGEYDISVLLLANEGDAKVSYQDVIIHPNILTDLYYRNQRKPIWRIKIASVFVKAFCKILKLLSVNVDKMHVRLNKTRLQGYDAVVSFGEGVATDFTQYIDIHPKTAWIHFEVSKLPYSQSFHILYDNFDHIVTVSDAIAEGLRRIYPDLAAKIIGIHNIIDVERVKRLSMIPMSEDFSNNEINIISLGRFSKVKRFPLIPIIAKELIDKGYPIKWRVFGPENDRQELASFNENINKNEVNGLVEYLGNKTNPYPYLKHSDIFVIVSETEACPMVITEARILNVPIVSANYTTASEFIEDGVDGFIRPIESISEAIGMIITQKDIRLHFLENSSSRILNNERIIQQFKSIVVS